VQQPLLENISPDVGALYFIKTNILIQKHDRFVVLRIHCVEEINIHVGIKVEGGFFQVALWGISSVSIFGREKSHSNEWPKQITEFFVNSFSWQEA
jgi:hypothetical protein